ncbi:MgtC/SapB family protein [Bradyrhizobium valentinum]|uniref:Protein MgtC n=1 Tax=Bradyrhizobium valentinum TaxID=1518501 RepID=A0A0R3LVN9_9BRAD|nr:MgtC/SapB family protein [Bradyrhizobium valentinum]KRQ99395.1 transporter [Bradyrhizobium valentinum]KRR09133.1 transporter [Bradyrhizobium valentinum]
MDRFQIGVHFVALAAAFALAVPIGWDREKRARSAGLRTFPLVALASCGFIQASEHLMVNSPDGMSKVIEGVITGIGFIGGGAILKHGTTVQGTATAASLWATGAIGVSVGLGSYDVAVMIAVFTFLTLRLLTLIKQEDDLRDGGKSDGKTDTRLD